MSLSSKACDLCYRRKIKCDGQIPHCSTCVAFKSDCTYKAASRKAPSRKQATAQRQLRESALQSRVQVLEDQLSTVLDKIERLEKTSGSQQDAPCSTSRHVSENVSQTYQAPSSPVFELPPYMDVLPVVEHYLATFNSILPLFHPGTLLQKVQTWYQNPHSRNPVIWALINVVLALGHHTSRPCDTSLIGNAVTYLNNAQSVLTEVIMRDADLANVQVLLGLVVLFWTADDLGPALYLVSTALRLAHRLGFHSRKHSYQLSPIEALQRNRVFWIAYILDRDISLRDRLPPVQLDKDIDLDLPPFEAKDDLTGFIFAADGHTKMNFFRSRVDLATIQGKVYECVYSASAQKSTSEERAQHVAHISHMLDDWTSKIPPEFHTTKLLQADMPGLSRYFCLLYSTGLSCRALISFASAWDSFHYSRWMGHMKDYGGKVTAGQVILRAPVPQGWHTLVNECREYMRLHATVVPIDTFFIHLISLTANSLVQPPYKAIESDKELTRTAMLFLEDLVKKTDRDKMQDMRDVLKQLECYADILSQKADCGPGPSELGRWDVGSGPVLFEPSDYKGVRKKAISHQPSVLIESSVPHGEQQGGIGKLAMSPQRNVPPPSVTAASWIASGTTWPDTTGNKIDAHGGQVFQHRSTFYCIGHSAPDTNSKSSTCRTHRVMHHIDPLMTDVTPGIYSSTDLLNWHFIGQVVPSATGAWRPKLAKPNRRYWVGLSLIELWDWHDMWKVDFKTGVVTYPTVKKSDLLGSPAILVGTIHAMVNGNEIYNILELNSHAGRRGTTPIQLKLLASDTNTISLRDDGTDLEAKVDGVEIFEEDFES
ncbi:fungal specific transcription factor [Seiridium cupressi]